MNQIKPAIILFALLTLITGVVYPLVVTAIAKMAFSEPSAASLIVADGKVVGSRLIGQAFSDPGHFWSRASATSPQAYNASSSSGSNQGPTNPALAEAVTDRIKVLRAADPGRTDPIPVDLVTASGSGLDPHISPAAAAWQVSRVARVRGLDETRVRQLVDAHTEGRQWAVLGEPRVNVLALNLALDKLK